VGWNANGIVRNRIRSVGDPSSNLSREEYGLLGCQAVKFGKIRRFGKPLSSISSIERGRGFLLSRSSLSCQSRFPLFKTALLRSLKSPTWKSKMCDYRVRLGGHHSGWKYTKLEQKFPRDYELLTALRDIFRRTYT
jgi:hypothetical protein